MPSGLTIYMVHTILKLNLSKSHEEYKFEKNSHSLSILPSFILTSGIFLKRHCLSPVLW
jgi:hypothetical protein